MTAATDMKNTHQEIDAPHPMDGKVNLIFSLPRALYQRHADGKKFTELLAAFSAGQLAGVEAIGMVPMMPMENGYVHYNALVYVGTRSALAKYKIREVFASIILDRPVLEIDETTNDALEKHSIAPKLYSYYEKQHYGIRWWQTRLDCRHWQYDARNALRALRATQQAATVAGKVITETTAKKYKSLRRYLDRYQRPLNLLGAELSADDMKVVDELRTLLKCTHLP